MKVSGRKKGLILCLAFVLFMGMAGTVLAWQYDQWYVQSTLWGRGGQPWAPYDGKLKADVWKDSAFRRKTNPVGDFVYWNPDALSYIRTHGQDVAITFHSFQKNNNGCSSFRVLDYAGTNLPAPQYLTYFRQCFPFQRTEGRIYSRDATGIAPYATYWGQAFFDDNINGNGTTQKITVDTYYGSQENWHQTYCIRPGEFLARVCSSADP